MQPAIQVVAETGWILAGVGLLAAFLFRRQWWPWLLLPLAPVAPILWSTGDLNSALAAFLAVGITAVGELAVGWRWWPWFLLIGSGVALVLLLSPDNFATFGVLFLLVEIAAAAGLPRRLGIGQRRRSLQAATA